MYKYILWRCKRWTEKVEEKNFRRKYNIRHVASAAPSIFFFIIFIFVVFYFSFCRIAKNNSSLASTERNVPTLYTKDGTHTRTQKQKKKWNTRVEPCTLYTPNIFLFFSFYSVHIAYYTYYDVCTCPQTTCFLRKLAYNTFILCGAEILHHKRSSMPTANAQTAE